ncbi:hypothetical protein HS125_07360 [bacterium]|nr:hypothetical protein [bacterium]
MSRLCLLLLVLVTLLAGCSGGSGSYTEGRRYYNNDRYEASYGSVGYPQLFSRSYYSELR